MGKLPVPGHPTIWITVGHGPTALAVGAGGDCLDIFTLIYPFSPLSPSLCTLTNCIYFNYSDILNDTSFISGAVTTAEGVVISANPDSFASQSESDYTVSSKHSLSKLRVREKSVMLSNSILQSAKFLGKKLSLSDTNN